MNGADELVYTMTIDGSDIVCVQKFKRVWNFVWVKNTYYSRFVYISMNKCALFLFLSNARDLKISILVSWCFYLYVRFRILTELSALDLINICQKSTWIHTYKALNFFHTISHKLRFLSYIIPSPCFTHSAHSPWLGSEIRFVLGEAERKRNKFNWNRYSMSLFLAEEV